MATFSIPISAFFFILLTVLNSIPTFSIATSPNKHIFDPNIKLLGGAHFSDNASHVILTRSGLITYKSPFKFIGSGSEKMVSFSTEFVFSSTGKGNVMSVIMGPHDFALELMGRSQFGVFGEGGFVGIGFDILVDSNVRDVGNASLVNVSVGNVFMNVLISSGEKLKSWVDYEASSKRLEVRLCKFGDRRPYNPLIAYSVDLLKVWGNSEVFVGLGSLNGHSFETSLYSWIFRLKKYPYSMHSLPADPHSEVADNEHRTSRKIRFCPFAALARMIFATGCGALVVFAVLFAWAVIASRTVFPVEGDVLPREFRYEKINVVVENDAKVIKN